MRINHNIQALNAYRNLSQTMFNTSKSLEKLSSGLRINRAADDAAGLAISEKMRSQIRGLDMAERNALDGVSLIQTGEGALNETHSILQRMRELSVQASNGTLTDEDRGAIQQEMDQLTFEVDRIADTTQFNQKKLFSGSEQGTGFAKISSDKISYQGLGKWAGQVNAEPTSPAAADVNFDSALGSDTAANIDGKTITINGKTYEIDTSATPSVVSGNISVNPASWIDSASTAADQAANVNSLMAAFKNAIDQNDPSFSVSKIDAVDNAGTFVAGKLSLTSNMMMSPKDVQDLGSDKNLSTDLSGTSFTNPYDADNPTTVLGSDLQSISASPVAITFSEVPKAGDQLKIDGLTINFGTPAAPYGSGAATIDPTGKDIPSVLNEINNVLSQAEVDTPNPVSALAPVHSVSNNVLTVGTNKTDDGLTNGLEIEMIDADFAANQGEDLKLSFQIGANQSETMDVSLSVMDAAKLGIARNADFTPLTTSGVNAVHGVDVSTAEAASSAISVFDNAIKMVSEERSKLGAVQNRLEHTVTNIQTANENLTSAESRIRDVDMAKEMSEFTKNNILNQAGQAMLAQANQLPQGVLQLLK
ncbi:flagellin N-terminal helical domain-containing protein [Falsibacillus albus]|uniref:Flagellin n=1 Tax=Falsibacillus albus TaxID=2478915 RepID=A0A3L7K2F3_9BACI|nr:flagellin [Falsibacillus albus]RLQ96795.1 flagellar protein [Falsibacillus albus]